MRALCAAIVCLTCAASTVSAQTTGADFQSALSPSLAAVAQSMHATIRRELAETAEVMSAEEYAFKPTPAVRSFGELLGHVVNANFFFCASARGVRSPSTRNFEQVSDKAVLVQGLRDALAYCDEVYAGITDASAGELITMPNANGKQSSRVAVLIFNTTHNNEHYGNMVVYLRLKGKVPPSTARTPPR
jgi:uncharacterized damage-inducible protein DinB